MAQLNDLLVLGKSCFGGAIKANSDHDLLAHSNEFNFISPGYNGDIYINYRTASGSDGNVGNYRFYNGKGTALANIYATTFYGALSGNATSATGFASAKTIALTGNVTGSATGGNGSNGWSISTTVASVPNGALPLRLRNYSTSGFADANEAIEQGFHYITSKTNGPSFVGTTSNDYRILTTAYSSSWLQQIATDYRNNEIYYRRKENGTWKSWVEIPTFDNVINNTAVGASGWVSGTAKRQLINHNTLAYWNGAYSGTSSNLQYCDRGRFGTIVTKNTGDYATASHGHSYLSGWSDTRSAATTPNDYNGQFKVVGIKQKALMDIDASSYSSLIGFRGWSDSSGGNAHELAFTGNGNLYHRHGATTAWNSWNRIPMCGTANTFSGTNTFSGQVIISNTTDAALSSASGALRIGAIAGEHIAIDGNEIMAKTSASATGTLYLNNEGGLVQIGSSGLTTSGPIGGGRLYSGYDSGVANSVSCSNWFRSNGATGWYNASYGNHLQPNTVTSYGGFLMYGNAKGGYEGITLGNSTAYMTLMSCDPHQGLYNEATGKWIIYYNKTNQYVSLGGAQTTASGYPVTLYGKTEITDSLKVNGVGYFTGGRVYGSGDDEGIILGTAVNGYAGFILGSHNGRRSVFYMDSSRAFWRYNNGSASYDIQHPGKSGTIALKEDMPMTPKLVATTYLSAADNTTAALTATHTLPTADYDYLVFQSLNEHNSGTAESVIDVYVVPTTTEVGYEMRGRHSTYGNDYVMCYIAYVGAKDKLSFRCSSDYSSYANVQIYKYV